MMHRNIMLALTVAAAAATACDGGGDRQCLEDIECASGFCRSDGTCAPPDEGDAGPDATDSGPNPGDGGDDLCEPNHDGTITRSETFLAPGNTAVFRMAADVTVDTAGTVQPGGGRLWNLSGPLAGDADVDVDLLPVAGAWFESSFAGATYAVRLSRSEDLLGVFELNDSALLLRGVVSPEAGLTRTELAYDPPVTVLSFPFGANTMWNSESTVTGLSLGVASIYTERYESRVDAVGDIDTPFGSFPVLRVRVDLTRTAGVTVVTKRTLMFISECFGTVASVVSNDYETEIDFTQASEVRRLAQ